MKLVARELPGAGALPRACPGRAGALWGVGRPSESERDVIVCNRRQPLRMVAQADVSPAAEAAEKPRARLPSRGDRGEARDPYPGPAVTYASGSCSTVTIELASTKNAGAHRPTKIAERSP